jgi:hypothetical protein
MGEASRSMSPEPARCPSHGTRNSGTRNGCNRRLHESRRLHPVVGTSEGVPVRTGVQLQKIVKPPSVL